MNRREQINAIKGRKTSRDQCTNISLCSLCSRLFDQNIRVQIRDTSVELYKIASRSFRTQKKVKLKINLQATKIEPLDHCVLWHGFLTSNSRFRNQEHCWCYIVSGLNSDFEPISMHLILPRLKLQGLLSSFFFFFLFQLLGFLMPQYSCEDYFKYKEQLISLRRST